jgi:hypothetical protein
MRHYTEAQAREAINYAEEIFMETKKIVAKRKA